MNTANLMKWAGIVLVVLFLIVYVANVLGIPARAVGVEPVIVLETPVADSTPENCPLFHVVTHVNGQAMGILYAKDFETTASYELVSVSDECLAYRGF